MIDVPTLPEIVFILARGLNTIVLHCPISIGEFYTGYIKDQIFFFYNTNLKSQNNYKFNLTSFCL
jgi:hypothetical protein